MRQLKLKKEIMSLFVDFSKAFVPVVNIWIKSLSAVGLSQQVAWWFANNVTSRTLVVQIEDWLFTSLISKVHISFLCWRHYHILQSICSWCGISQSSETCLKMRAKQNVCMFVCLFFYHSYKVSIYVKYLWLYHFSILYCSLSSYTRL